MDISSILIGVNVLNIKCVDAIVNPTNHFLSHGEGLCGQVYKAAGPELDEFTRNIDIRKTGECIISPGFNLGIKNIVHVITPVYQMEKYPIDALVKTYENILETAMDNGIKSIVIPLLSSDHNGYPYLLSVKCALYAIEDVADYEELAVYLVLNEKQIKKLSIVN